MLTAEQKAVGELKFRLSESEKARTDLQATVQKLEKDFVAFRKSAEVMNSSAEQKRTDSAAQWEQEKAVLGAQNAQLVANAKELERERAATAAECKKKLEDSEVKRKGAEERVSLLMDKVKDLSQKLEDINSNSRTTNDINLQLLQSRAAEAETAMNRVKELEATQQKLQTGTEERDGEIVQLQAALNELKVSAPRDRTEE